MKHNFAKGKLSCTCNIEDANCKLTEFYQRVADACNLHNIENKKMDCREIEVSQNIQQAIIDHYITNKEATSEQVAALLLLAGPKVNEDLNENEVAISDCFLV